MQINKKKRKLNVIQDDTILEDKTCFAAHAEYKVDCNRKSCNQWISHPESHNCVMLAAKNGPHTLQKIGQIYGLTRMRICQIEKNIFDKIRKIS